MKIAVVDYGIGNLGSVTKAFRRFGAEPLLSGDAAELSAADALVLPGDGAFGASRDELERRGLSGVLRAHVESGRVLLGICIGMQLLFDESEEHGRHQGFGFLPGRVRRFDSEKLVVPHMGWNRLSARRPHPLLEGLPQDAYVYFVHSYWCDAAPEVVVATSDYGHDFAAVVARDNVIGVQFHPEKSQGDGLRMVENFVNLVRERVAA